MKKLLLAGVMALNLIAPCFSAHAATYSDVKASHWAYSNIQTATENGWFSGDGNGTFRPNDTITRAEAAKVLYLATESTATSGFYFSDTQSHWAKNYATLCGYMFLDASNLAYTPYFEPDRAITREETILAFILGYHHMDKINDTDVSSLEKFDDIDDLSSVLYPFASLASELSLITGSSTSQGGYNLNPKDTLTRAEFATLLVRASDVSQGISSIETPTSNISYTINTSYNKPVINIYCNFTSELFPYTRVYLNDVLMTVDGTSTFSNSYFVSSTDFTIKLETLDIYGNISEKTIYVGENAIFGNTSTLDSSSYIAKGTYSNFEVDTSYLPEGEAIDFVLEVVSLVNALRAEHGLCSLIPTEELFISANAKVHDMINNNYFGHFDNDGNNLAQNFNVGENIAGGQVTPQAVFDAWLESDGHKANMLYPGYKYIGVGYEYDANSRYKHYWSQHFSA